METKERTNNVTFEFDLPRLKKIVKYCEGKSRLSAKTTPEEVAYYAKIRDVRNKLYENIEKAETIQKRAYEAENRPLVGTLQTDGMFTPKSAALKAVDARLSAAMDASARFLRSVGTKRMRRLHHLELAGVFDT